MMGGWKDAQNRTLILFTLQEHYVPTHPQIRAPQIHHEWRDHVFS